MFDLLHAALRQRPDRIIIGEIRGVEGNIAFQAMQTGHGVMATFHASSVQKLIQRLTGDPINVPKTYMPNLDLVVIQMAVRGPERQHAAPHSEHQRDRRLRRGDQQLTPSSPRFAGGRTTTPSSSPRT